MQIKVFNIRLDKEHFEHDQKEMNQFLSGVTFKKSSSKFVEGANMFWSIIVHYEENNVVLTEEPVTQIKESETSTPELSTDEQVVVEHLKQWRTETANEKNLAAFMVLTNKTIEDLARKQPRSIEDLDQIHGIGEGKKEEYGEEIIALLNSI